MSLGCVSDEHSPYPGAMELILEGTSLQMKDPVFTVRIVKAKILLYLILL